jgi:hypothetical protein
MRVSRFIQRKPTNCTSAFVWIALSVMVLGLDHITGPNIQFPVFFVPPVLLAAWFQGRGWSVVMAVTMPLLRALLFYDRVPPFYALVNAAIFVSVLILLALLTARMGDQYRRINKELRILHGILPICAFCKKIRSGDNEWIVLESYITEHSEASFSHGLCPECLKKHYPGVVSKIADDAHH